METHWVHWAHEPMGPWAAWSPWALWAPWAHGPHGLGRPGRVGGEQDGRAGRTGPFILPARRSPTLPNKSPCHCLDPKVSQKHGVVQYLFQIPPSEVLHDNIFLDGVLSEFHDVRTMFAVCFHYVFTMFSRCFHYVFSMFSLCFH